MSSTLKRVPLDFKWPLKEVWKGYVNPYGPESPRCTCCDGAGYSPFAHLLYEAWCGYRAFKPEDSGSQPFLPTDKAVLAQVEPKVARDLEFYEREARLMASDAPDPFAAISYRTTLADFEAKWGVSVDREALGALSLAVQSEAIRMCNIYNSQLEHHLNEDDVLALVKEDCLRELTHDFVPGQGWSRKEPVAVPSVRAVNEWSLAGLAHGSSNMHVVIRARCERANEPVFCESCEGDGWIRTFESDEHKARFEAWEEYEPPVGEGYQYWETVSEGSPVSPVFETISDLARWLVVHRNPGNLSFNEWLKVLDEGGAGISMVMVGGRMYSGEQAVAQGVLGAKKD